MKFERLGDKVTQVRGISYTPNDISVTPLQDYVPVLKANNIKERGIDTTDLIYIHRSKIKPEQFIKKGDLLLAASSGSKDIVGKNIFFENDFDGSFGAFCKLVRPKKNIYPKFVGVFFKTPYFKRHIRRLISGSLINNLKNEHIDSLLVPLLSEADQQHIANILSKAESLIARRKESLDLLDQFLKCTFLEMFGTNIDNDRKWETIKLIEACSNKNGVKCGPFGTQLSKSEYQMNGIPVWGIPQINSLFKILPKEFLTEAKALELDDYSVIPLDIVMSRKGNVGKCSLFPEHFSKGIIHSDVLRIRPNKTIIHPVFLLFQLKYSKHVEIQIKGVTKGAIMAGINVGMLKHIYIHRPPIGLQSVFAQIVEKTEVLRTQYQQSLQELENLYGNLSQSAFKGELFKGKALSNVEVNESVVKGIPIERKTLAGWIIQMFNDNPKFGVTMFQKNLHLCEYFSEVKYETNYSQNRAGPDDRGFMKEFLGEMAEKKWYRQEQKFKLIRFVPDENAGKLVKKYGEYFKSRARRISFVLNLLKDKSLDDAELISTLYAVWNNRILRKEIIEPDLLANDVFSWSEEKNKYTRAEIKIMYEWMNEKGLIPVGFGKEIMKR